MYINETPVKTWYWLNLNGTDIGMKPVDGKSLKTIKTDAKETKNGFKDSFTGMGKPFSEFVSVAKTEKKSFVFEKDEVLVIRYKSEFTVSDMLCLNVRENAKATVYMIFESDNKDESCQYITTKAKIEKNGELKLYQLSKLSKKSLLFADTVATCSDNAIFEPHLLYLGSDKTYAGMRTDLNGEYSSLKCESVYFGINEKEYDFNYSVNHYGKKTNSEIFVDGSLNHNSKKNFKGTIDFKTGSSGSVGLERESVLLLGDDVVNKTLPIILCSEEDVQGNHGASIGRIDDSIMFYLKSRGLDEEQVERMMTSSMIKSRIKKIDDTDIKNEMNRFFDNLLSKR